MTVIIRCCDPRFVWYGTDSLGIYLSIESSSLGGFFYSLLGRYDIFYYFLPYLNLIKTRFAYICLKYIIYEFLKKKKPIMISILIYCLENDTFLFSCLQINFQQSISIFLMEGVMSFIIFQITAYMSLAQMIKFL